MATRNTDVRILEADAFFADARSRMPIKFGGVVMDHTKFCHVRVLVENRAGRRAEGWGAILLADHWAWPTGRVDHAARDELMRRLVSVCCRRAVAIPDYAHPIGLFTRLEPEVECLAQEVVRDRKAAEPMPRLAAVLCLSPLDAAIHDAFGKAAGIDTCEGYGKEHMEHDLSRWLGPDFRGRYLADFLTPMPPALDAFHLLGGLDKLTESELGPDDPSDGLPVSLDQWIRRDGLRSFKIKLRGNDLEWDLRRMLDVVSVIRQEQSRLRIGLFWLSADTNEMCESPEYMEELLKKFRENDPAAFDRLLYVEQPCERDLSRRKLDVRKLAAIRPVLVDESLVSLADFDRALELGYSGGALKTCKCQSMELLLAAKAKQIGCPISVQDLANPGIALIQSVKLAGHLRPIHGVEYNSRQFYPSLSDPERRVHPDVFRLHKGRIDTRSIHGPGLGYRWEESGRGRKGEG